MKKNTIKRISFYALLVLIAVSIFFIGKGKVRTRTLTTTEYLDTICDIAVVSASDKPLNICADYLEFAHNEFSAEDENSTLYKFNNGENPELSEDFTELLSYGDEFSQKYSDLFSIYLDPLIKAWNVTENSGVIPDVKGAMDVAADQKAVNFGGIAKGFITDKLVNKLKAAKVESALINLGGNTYAMGKKQTGENWKIGISDPKNENKIIGTITAENIAVITSGDYQRYFEAGGKRYHHIFDPTTGYPADSGVHSVTVIHSSATLADALSTAAFVAGVEKGNELIKSCGATGIFITDDTIYFSKDLENIFKQNDFSYKYEFLY